MALSVHFEPRTGFQNDGAVNPDQGAGGRGFSFFRIGYVEQHKINLTGHWLGRVSGSYNTGFLFALKGERIVVDHAFEVREGSVSLSFRHYDGRPCQTRYGASGFANVGTARSPSRFPRPASTTFV